MLYATTNCHDGFWRTMPELVLDERQYGINSEQIDTDQEDHCSDEVTYACMSRPWMRLIEKQEKREKDWFREKETEASWRTV